MDVNNNNGLCMVVDFLFDFVEINIVCNGVYIHEYRDCILTENRLGCCPESEGRNNDLISRFHSGTCNTGMHCRCTGIRYNAVFNTAVFCPLLLKGGLFGRFRPPDNAPFQNLLNSVHVVLGNDGPRFCQSIGYGFFTALYCELFPHSRFLPLCGLS